MSRIASSLAVLAALSALSACSSGLRDLYDRETLVLTRAQRAAAPFGPLSGDGPWPGAYRVASNAPVAEGSSAPRYHDVVVYFDVGSESIGPDGQRALRSFVYEMEPRTEMSILVEGFAEATGSEAEEHDLSDRRARAVADFLRAEGIPAARVASHGTALDESMIPPDRLSNRRVDVRVR